MENSIKRSISILYRYGQSYLNKRLGSLRIGSGQYIYVTTLNRKSGISQEELSSMIKIDKATTARAVKKLEEEGYIIRETDLLDKRAYRLFLSPQATEIVPFIQEASDDWEKAITADFTEEEMRWASQLLNKMVKNACQLKGDIGEIKNEKNRV